jgi:inner membrane protein involved in colicin E2 resistance
MKILPANIEEQIDRVDRNRSLAIGIGSGVLALWCLYRVLWSLYLMMTYDFLFGSLLFGVVLWGVIGAVAAISAFGFLTRYARRP